MSKKDEEFLKRLLATFRVEAEEHLNAISAGLVEIERSASPEDRARVLETAYREAHSLKGAARAVNLTDVEHACQSLEAAFAVLKQRGESGSAGLSDALFGAVDSIGARLASPEGFDAGRLSRVTRELADLAEGLKREGLPAPAAASPAISAPPGGDDFPASPSPSAASRSPAGNPDSQALEKTGGAAQPPAQTRASHPVTSSEEPGPSPLPVSSTGPSRPALSQTVRIAMERLDALLLQSEEMLSAKLGAEQRALELRETAAGVDLWAKQWSAIRQEAHRARMGLATPSEDRPRRAGGEPSFTKLLQFLDQGQARVKALQARLVALTRVAEQDYRSLGGMLDHLLEDVKNALLLPFSSLLEAFPKMVREIARDQGKEVELVLRGSEVEADKRILAAMKDPLIHLVRNSIDHGLEKPDERERRGKKRKGTIVLSISQIEGGRVEILVSDDGAGIDPARVRVRGVEIGILSRETASELDDAAALRLVFQSGFSTSPILTDLSGRGLGLAIVREKVDELGGVVSIDTRPGAGTTFRLVLPLLLSTFRGVLVQAGGRPFVIPTTSIERVLRVRPGDVSSVENREVLTYEGRPVSLVRLAQVLEIASPPSREDREKPFPTIVVAAAGERIAFGVDAVLNEQEVLVKGLGKQLSRVRNVAAATVLGSGVVVPILNVADLARSARRAAAGAPVVEPRGHEEADRTRSILLVEDSITSRMLLQGILESAGYRVKTAVDGSDAFATLRTEGFDLVVSDVQMPRMDGFELTARIRGDEKLGHLPVVLVTSLESREDREKGIDAGANAYIVKSSFDQSNLLEVVRRLI